MDANIISLIRNGNEMYNLLQWPFTKSISIFFKIITTFKKSILLYNFKYLNILYNI